jgi:hypothetical protein
MEFSERTGAGTGQPRASSILIDPLHEYGLSGEVLQQCDLLVGEWTILTIDG